MQKDLEVYRDNLIEQRIQTFRNTYYENSKDIRKACFLYPLIVAIDAGILYFFNLMLDVIPILPTILEAFHLDKTLYWIAGITWVICILWLLIGCVVYPIKQRKNRSDLRRAIKKEKAWNPHESEMIIIMAADDFCPTPSWPFEKKTQMKITHRKSSSVIVSHFLMKKKYKK